MTYSTEFGPNSTLVPFLTDGQLPIPGAAEHWFGQVALETRLAAAGEPVPHGITYRQFCDAYEAVAYANCSGLIMDTRVDVTWSTLGIVDADAIDKFETEFLSLLEIKFMRMGVPFIWYRVREVGRVRGLHSHFTLHVPRANTAVFESFCEVLLTTATGRKLRTDPNNKTVNIEVGRGDLESQWARLRYVMKGVSPYAVVPAANADDGVVPLAAFAELDQTLEGMIVGSRVKVSANLAAANWAVERHELPDMLVRDGGPQLYTSRYLDWHRQRCGQGSFRGEFALRNAARLLVPFPDAGAKGLNMIA